MAKRTVPGEHLVEWTVKSCTKETAERFRLFFDKLPEKAQEKIIISGSLNLLFDIFTEKELKEMLDFLLEDSKENISQKRYVRYSKPPRKPRP
jgi:imidazolonepropionase-like amidohydrolase